MGDGRAGEGGAGRAAWRTAATAPTAVATSSSDGDAATCIWRW
jgi:hypothetical protein